MRLYDYQIQVSQHLQSGRSVILQAPTGAGKTLAALWPYLEAWDRGNARFFPRKCIYSVPMRTLANQFVDEIQKLTENDMILAENPTISIHTGEHPNDPKFESDLIFTTIDQTLSSFLGIPYSLSLGQSNLNAGAVASSYLIFDEFHLFPPQALATTLQMLKMLNGITPFLLMTATFSQTMLAELSNTLNAVVVTQGKGKIDFQSLPSQQKERRYHTVNHPITAEDVLAQHKTRSIAICNTVQRAQDLYTALKEIAPEGVEIKLLHSRFYKEDRTQKEEWLRREFGKDKNEYTVESAILVATQVIEVGLDITSESLHTELAPANAVLQRAGRCARYSGEKGNVFIYRLPEKENKNGEMEPQYAPYHTDGQKELCKKTWTTFAVQNGNRFTFIEEQDLLSDVHGERDRQVLQELQAGQSGHRKKMQDAMARQEYRLASDLIRDVNNINIIVHPDPNADTDPTHPSKLKNPWRWQSFGLFAGSVYGAFDTLQELADDIGHDDWTMMFLHQKSPEGLEEWETAEERYEWLPVTDRNQLRGALLVAVHPRLAQYSSETGFQLGVDSGKNWCVPERKKTPRRGDRRFTFHRETYLEHITGLHKAYQYKWDGDGTLRQALKDDMAYTFSRYEQQNELSAGTMDTLARFIIAGHDLGKLGKKWQDWAHNWQELSQIHNPAPPDEMLAHTDYDGSIAQRELQKKQGKRPPHAAESAYALRKPAFCAAGRNPNLTRAALTAIARHHTATHQGHVTAFQPASGAQTALESAFSQADIDSSLLTTVTWTFSDDDLANMFIESDKVTSQVIPYFLLVRVLRLADQRSQQ